MTSEASRTFQWTWPWPTCICHVQDDHAPTRQHSWYCYLAEKLKQLTNEQVREMMA